MSVLAKLLTALTDHYADLRSLDLAACEAQERKEMEAMMRANRRLSIAHHYRRRNFLRERIANFRRREPPETVLEHEGEVIIFVRPDQF